MQIFILTQVVPTWVHENDLLGDLYPFHEAFAADINSINISFPLSVALSLQGSFT